MAWCHRPHRCKREIEFTKDSADVSLCWNNKIIQIISRSSVVISLVSSERNGKIIRISPSNTGVFPSIS